MIQSDLELFGVAESRIFFPDPRQDATFEMYYFIFAVFNLMVVKFVVDYINKFFLKLRFFLKKLAVAFLCT